MSGYIEEAMAALNVAAEQVPLEMIQSAEGKFTEVTQYIQQVGGPSGDALTREAGDVAASVSQCITQCHMLREKILEHAARLASGGS